MYPLSHLHKYNQPNFTRITLQVLVFGQVHKSTLKASLRRSCIRNLRRKRGTLAGT